MKQQKSLHKVLTENIGFVFVLPWLIGFLLFKVYPFASSLYYTCSGSMHRARIMKNSASR